MRSLIVFLTLTLITITSFGQMPGRNGGAKITGRFYGKVVDQNNKGIEAATVTLVQEKVDSATKQKVEAVVGGMLTLANGDFNVENIPVMGKYKLQITGIGYKQYNKPFAFERPSGGDMMSALDKDLGNIKLDIDDKILSNVTVTSSKPSMQLGIDRKIFNVEQSLVSAGGSAVDVLKNVPSINVDIDGNVSLRNSAPTVFVDGRPTTLTLDQIPADAIESVEVITNPSAKYDASGGTAGILNIVLKKTKRVGYSGNVRANIDSRGKVGGGVNVNVRQNKVNFFAMGNYNQRKSIGSGTTDRLNYSNKDTSLTYQKDYSTMNGAFGFGRAGFDYFIDNRNTFTLNGSFFRGNMSPENNSDIWSYPMLNNRATDTTFSPRYSTAQNEFSNSGVQASFKHIFPKSGHEWTADANYSKGKNTNTNDIRTESYNLPENIFLNSFITKQIGGGNNDNLTLQTDYTNPLSDKSKLELGARASIRTVSNITNYYFLDKDGALTPRAGQNINYESRDRVYAAYANFANRINNFGYQLGLRAESSDYVGNVINKGETFNIEFPISLFPSLFLSQKVGENDEFQFNYSRRINRPNFWQLFPFYDLSDSLNISRGNANLKPEFTNSYELSYSKTFKNRDNFLASLYFKNTNDLITRVQAFEYVDLIDTTALVLNYINANKSYLAGLELTSRNKIKKWWEVVSSANFYTANIDLTDQEDPEQFLSYFLRINNTFTLPHNFSFQASADYNSKRLVTGAGGGGGGRGGWGGQSSSAQGYILPQWGFDAAIKYDFLKDKAASISLSVNDLFKTRVYDAHTASQFFVQDVYRIRDQQIFRLNFNYRFGKFDASLFKRKNTRNENMSAENATF